MDGEGEAKREREDAPDAGAADDAPSPKAARVTEAEAEAPAAAPREWPHGKKRKVVVLFGYVGAGYQGMQRNPGARTIEDELERAFYAAGGISDENMGDFSKARRTQRPPPGRRSG
jgi:tRNA pseudouridine38-40 synthase